MAEQAAQPRGPRGSYAPLICLKCRSRKIKCRLPDNLDIVASELPQPAGSACQRCQALGLDCVVQKTVLGRPGAKRKRVRGDATSSIEIAADAAKDATGDVTEFEVQADVEEVKSYLLSEFTEENVSPPAETVKKPLDAREKFESMISFAHLLAALVSRDPGFGSKVLVAPQREPVAVWKVISQGMAALLDENLVWHRFLGSNIPTLVALRQQLQASQGTYGDSATPLLFALLALMAVEAPSNQLRDDVKLREQLRETLAYLGESFLLAPPPTRHSLAVLLLLFNYRPTALIKIQIAASTAVKTDIFVVLAIRTAEKLGFQAAQFSLSDLSNRTPAEVERLIKDALDWCLLVAKDAFADGFFTKPMPLMHDIYARSTSIVHTVQSALQHQRPTISTLLQYHQTLAVAGLIKGLIDTKQAWRDLDTLIIIVETHEQTSQAELLDFHTAVQQARTENDRDEETKAASAILSMTLERLQATVSGVAMFYALMSRLNPARSLEPRGADIEPTDVLQISDQIIGSLQELRIGRALDLANFLARLGGPRDDRILRILAGFIDAADTLNLDGVPFAPPPRQEALVMLYWCRVLVDNNAARMKGWGGLHEDTDKQLELIAGCAQKLEAMATSPGVSLSAAFAKGCLYAASAKLIRCLHRIVLGWQAVVQRKEKDGAEAEEITPETLDSGGGDVEFDFDLNDFDFNELFGQWGSWPHSDDADLLGFMPDEVFMS